MQDTKQIVQYALHTFLEQVEAAIHEGYAVHKTPATFAKLIGGRYVVTMVKPSPSTEAVVGAVAQTPPTEPAVIKPSTTRKLPAKKAQVND